MASGTVHLHRVLRAPASRVYRAFIEPLALAKWLPPYGYTCEVHHLTSTVGGRFRMSFHNFGADKAHSFGGEYLELQPFEKIRYVDRFEDPGLAGTMEVTITLRAVSCGVELGVVQAGIPEIIPLELCYLGWQESLSQLALLVEPEIAD